MIDHIVRHHFLFPILDCGLSRFIRWEAMKRVDCPWFQCQGGTCPHSNRQDSQSTCLLEERSATISRAKYIQVCHSSNCCFLAAEFALTKESIATTPSPDDLPKEAASTVWKMTSMQVVSCFCFARLPDFNIFSFLHVLLFFDSQC